MNEHDAMRELLSLAAAGALDAAEQAKLGGHLAGCPACAAELDAWRELAGSLKRLPTPQAPLGLVERVRTLAERQLAAEAERRWNQGVMVFLVLFAWTVTLAGWPIVRLMSDGVAGWLDLRFTHLWIALIGYTALGWLTAGVAAVALGVRHRRTKEGSMSRFREELSVIPRGVWFLAVAIYFLFAELLLKFAMLPDPKFATWPMWGKVLFAHGTLLVLPVLVLLIGYVNRDAKRRGMRHVVWTLLAIFIPNGIGIILYFVLRDPLPLPCPKCGVAAPAKFTFCPHCGTALKPSCPQCGKSVEHGWSHCAYCGAKIGGQAPTRA